MSPTYDVFLSHNSADKAAVELVALRLRDEARLGPFLDKWHLVPGESWTSGSSPTRARYGRTGLRSGPQ